MRLLRTRPRETTVATLRHQVIRKIAAAETSGPLRATPYAAAVLTELYSLLHELERTPRTARPSPELVVRWLEVKDLRWKVTKRLR